ncbi:TRAP transporter small permease subunit [Enterovibrio norvegicus]|uniref:TRAP transporter small permease protein n=2 Tax=Enterovibrio norvegicus TaxID=188144 RepID=A0A1I5THJ0_9GAMM|nr:TRAP transporter small permease subunit [Enterovibrio norvegicus]OEF55082.1 C4-dicarboxylate ABC transporter permease [Enterovibrio norvegicus]SFP82534.1 TRAP-type mannitol/chloroaromatic compound transport system, small permease component [Enterovibrio norvegicus DSM 15893]
MNTASPQLIALIKGINRFSDWTGRIVSWFVLAIVLITFVVVVMRYVLNSGSVFLQESVLYFHNYVIMLGAAYALLKGAHVRVDIFYRPMSEKKKAWVDLLGFLFLLLPTCSFIFYIAWDYVSVSWQIMEGSQEAGGVEAKYLFKTSILLMPALVIIQGFAEALKSLMTITGHQDIAKQLEDHDEEHAL